MKIGYFSLYRFYFISCRQSRKCERMCKTAEKFSSVASGNIHKPQATVEILFLWPFWFDLLFLKA